MTLCERLCNDNELHQLPRNSVKCTVAPRQYSSTDLCAIITKTEIAPLALNAMKLRWIPFTCCTFFCTVAYSARLFSTAVTPSTQRLHEDLDTQRLRIKYAYENVHATTAHPVLNEYNPLKANDGEETVSAHVRNDVKPY